MSNPLDDAIARLNELEPGLRSLDTLFSLGVITSKGEGEFNVGDWDFQVWACSIDGFSVGAIRRERQNDLPFPAVVHEQKKWIICSTGQIRVETETEKRVLRAGERMTIEPMVSHAIYGVTEQGAAVLVMVPADPGMSR